jgi:hypothetical protein
MGPVDIVVEKSRITAIRSDGTFGLPIDPKPRLQLKEGGKELNRRDVLAAWFY